MGQLFNIPKFQFTYLQPVVGYPGGSVVKNPPVQPVVGYPGGSVVKNPPAVQETQV